MRLLSVADVIEIYCRVIDQSGGLFGIRDLGALDSAVSQPSMTFGGVDLYPTIPEKAAALGFSLIQNHPFVDGNKRTGHAALETFLVLNGYELKSQEGDQFDLIMSVASGIANRESFTEWVVEHSVLRTPQVD